MLNKKQKMLENIVKSLSVSVSDLTSQVELLKSEINEIKKQTVYTKDLKMTNQEKE